MFGIDSANRCLKWRLRIHFCNQRLELIFQFDIWNCYSESYMGIDVTERCSELILQIDVRNLHSESMLQIDIWN